MTDIVERLDNLLEADPDPAMCELYATCKVEIERLRTQCGGNCRYWEGRWRDEKADNARLQALLGEWSSSPKILDYDSSLCWGCGELKTKPHLSDCLLDRTCRALEPKTLLEKVEAANRCPVGDRHS